MSKIYKIIAIVLASISVLLGIVSLFLPYLIKSNIHGGDLSLPKFYDGFHYSLSSFIIALMIANVVIITRSIQKVFLFISLFFILLTTYLVRNSIHFQGMIDHDYDSRTGVGFKLLFLAVIIQLATSVMLLILTVRKK